MIKKWIGTQIILNNIPNSYLNKNGYLKKKLSIAKEVLGLDALMVWSDVPKKELDLIRGICKDLKIKTYLWYPVLADVTGLKIEQEQEVETFDGLHSDRINKTVMGNGRYFLFDCPNDEQNIRQIFSHYQNKIIESDFDGVFLDHIRFPSPSNGFKALFSCFCKSCRNKFHSIYSEDLEDYKYQAKAVFEKFKTIDINYFRNCQSLSDFIIQDNLKKFYDFRKQSVYRIVKMFADEARQRGKLVGLDLFAPSLAPLVSQDYQLLARTCDWIKPMIYSHSSGPAGFPLELSCLLRAILDINPALDEEKLIQAVSRLLGVDLPTQLDDLLKNGISENIISREMEKIREFNLPEKVDIYVGLEAVQIPGYCYIDKSILKKYLKSVIEEDIKGILLSMDLIKIPDENLKLVGDFLLK